ncbi:sigma-70 family RNA polymerase sigma factor [Dinghuibacter silviterrae]|uniref:RNA polymerase sigma-70 factor (ECF subfamily) n=1 Tax=Dinghuibacter silviterrae TaxID=1539049 RepID=A0A4R8DSI2_9BACT|nr:sigma-70 family RNA polymerase sigma factor [Dinghuibacter silviterrae]TDX00826.1 RNA polymerase sigma-70 factor (ECF subfamily) [Dinghuibacter silviterrae]
MQTTVDRSASGEDVLLRDFREGDTQALKHIFQLHWKTQVFFASRFIPEQDISEDIVSEAFLKLWSRREGFSSLPSIRAFLYTATRNACVDHLRKVKGQKAFQKEFVHIEQDRLQEDEFNEVVRAELMAKIMSSIDLLPSQYRKVMHLSTQGMDTEAIAREMNLSPKIVRNYKARAINILRKDLLDKSSLLLLLSLCSAHHL